MYILMFCDAKTISALAAASTPHQRPKTLNGKRTSQFVFVQLCSDWFGLPLATYERAETCARPIFSFLLFFFLSFSLATALLLLQGSRTSFQYKSVAACFYYKLEIHLPNIFHGDFQFLFWLWAPLHRFNALFRRALFDVNSNYTLNIGITMLMHESLRHVVWWLNFRLMIASRSPFMVPKCMTYSSESTKLNSKCQFDTTVASMRMHLCL